MTEQGRPTALVRRVDMSTVGQRASGAPASSFEETLFEGYRGTGSQIESRPCVCGGQVHAAPNTPGRGVAAHNFGSRHKAWRANREDQ